MSGNIFGSVFRAATFGESHGKAIGVIVEGVPAGLEFDPGFIQHELDRRRPGQSEVSTPRAETDCAEVLSGVFEGRFTGMPVCIVIRNTAQKPQDYAALAEVFRPGHADRVLQEKYGFRDYRGGGRSSGRETAARVAAGAVAKLFLNTLGVKILAYAAEIAGVKAGRFDPAEIERNAVRAPDAEAAEAMKNAVLAARAEGDSTGGVIGCRVSGVPAGWGEPVFDKLDALLAHAMLSIGGVKGFTIGSGFDAARLRGSVNNAETNSGGVLGGISTGGAIEFRIAVKPTPSIAKTQQTVGADGKPAAIQVHGRHDPCIVPRVVPVVEAMTALVLADLALRNRATRLTPDCVR